MMGRISRGKIEQASKNTHHLKRVQAGSAGAKESKQAEKLTSWKGEDRQGQHEQKRASKQRHSPSEGRKTGRISKGKKDQASKALTHWRGEDRQGQQGQKRPSKHKHSQPGEERTDRVSRGKSEQASRVTHPLKRGGQGGSAEAQESK
jgi:hypothetical protein